MFLELIVNFIPCFKDLFESIHVTLLIQKQIFDFALEDIEIPLDLTSQFNSHFFKPFIKPNISCLIIIVVVFFCEAF